MHFPIITPDMILVKDLAEQHFLLEWNWVWTGFKPMFFQNFSWIGNTKTIQQKQHTCIFASWLLREMRAFPNFLSLIDPSFSFLLLTHCSLWYWPVTGHICFFAPEHSGVQKSQETWLNAHLEMPCSSFDTLNRLMQLVITTNNSALNRD